MLLPFRASALRAGIRCKLIIDDFDFQGLVGVHGMLQVLLKQLVPFGLQVLSSLLLFGGGFWHDLTLSEQRALCFS